MAGTRKQKALIGRFPASFFINTKMLHGGGSTLENPGAASRVSVTSLSRRRRCRSALTTR